MKKVSKRLATLVLSGLLIVGSAFPAFAGDIPRFPYQNRNSFQTNYTKAVQAMLMDYSTATLSKVLKYGADGSYGPATEEAVRIFQKSEKISVDGSCGHDTWTQIDTIREEQSKDNIMGYTYYYFGGKWIDRKKKVYRRVNLSSVWMCHDGSGWVLLQ